MDRRPHFFTDILHSDGLNLAENGGVMPSLEAISPSDWLHEWFVFLNNVIDQHPSFRL